MMKHTDILRRSGPMCLALTIFVTAGCGGGDDAPMQLAEQGTTATITDERREIAMHGVEIVRVTLERPRGAPDVYNEWREWEEAYSVRLSIDDPPSMGPSFDIFVGERRVPEYGGWEEGIYFWVYDPAELESIDGEPVFYSFAGSERQMIGNLALGDLSQIVEVQEADLLTGKR